MALRPLLTLIPSLHHQSPFGKAASLSLLLLGRTPCNAPDLGIGSWGPFASCLRVERLPWVMSWRSTGPPLLLSDVASSKTCDIVLRPKKEVVKQISQQQQLLLMHISAYYRAYQGAASEWHLVMFGQDVLHLLPTNMFEADTTIK